jgi:hypothetical protein
MPDELKLKDFDFEIASQQDLRERCIDEPERAEIWRITSRTQALTVCVSIERDEQGAAVGWQFADTVVDRTFDLDALSHLIERAKAAGLFAA